MGYNKYMFRDQFSKIATIASMITPEDYYELVHEKDPYVGAVLGATVGGAVGGYKGAKGSKSKSALIGAALGGASGAVTGHYVGKGLKHYQANKVRRIQEDLNLRSTPSRKYLEY